MRNVVVIGACVIMSAGLAQSAELCVTNASDAAHYFTVEAADGAREARWLDPNEKVCLTASGNPGARVAAFDDPQSIEGCTRLLGPSNADTLLEFANFDRCHWASQDD